MARRRMIDPNFWQSEDVSKLTVRQRLLLIGLFSNADDHGKGRAKASYVRSTIFPYDDLTITEIEADLQEIAQTASIVFYEVDGNSYYSFTNWEKWQTVQKPQHSLIPDPVENDSILSQESVQNDSRLKERKGKEEKRKEAEEERKERSASAGKNISSIILFQQELGRLLTSIEAEEITSLENDFGYDLVKEALKRAVVNGKRNIRYVQAILNRWHSAGLRTIIEVLDYEAEIDKRKGIENPVINLSEEAAKKLEKEKAHREDTIKSAVYWITQRQKVAPTSPEAIEYARGYDEVIPGVSVDIIEALEKVGGAVHAVN